VPDTTLSALLPSVPLQVGGRQLEVRPIIYRELRLVERAMEGWTLLVASGGEQMDPEAWEAFLQLLAGACGQTVDQVKALEECDFERLACLVLAMNREIWDAPKGRGDDEPLTWAQIVQRLVSHGHPWEAVQNMTMGQIRSFLEACLRHERETLAMQITAASFSMAEPKTVQKATRELRRG
jgi:hypothetical protein